MIRGPLLIALTVASLAAGVQAEPALGSSYKEIVDRFGKPTARKSENWFKWEHPHPFKETDMNCRFSNNKLQLVQLESLGNMDDNFWASLEHWTGVPRQNWQETDGLNSSNGLSVRYFYSSDGRITARIDKDGSGQMLTIAFISWVKWLSQQNSDTDQGWLNNIPRSAPAATISAHAFTQGPLTAEEQALHDKNLIMEVYEPDNPSGHDVWNDEKTGSVLVYNFGIDDATAARDEGRSMAGFNYTKEMADKFLFAEGWDKYHDRFFTRAYVQEGMAAYTAARKK
jgi:hypothetical protein